MRKQGILLKNALGMFIAVIGLIFLGFIAWKLYSYTVNQDSENAKDSLTALMARVDALEDGQSNSFLIRGVEGWQLTGWSRNTPDTPSKCALESCVCICPTASSSSCQESGFCRPVKGKSVFVGTPIIREEITNERVTLHHEFRPFIDLPDNLMDVFISKNSTHLNITALIDPIAVKDYQIGPEYGGGV